MQADGKSMLLLNFRFFLKSVFMTLKRQFNPDEKAANRDGSDAINEKVFHAEMFLVDHFWQYICQNENLVSQSDTGHLQKLDGNSTATTSTEVESIPMELLQRKLFEFFDRR